MRTGLPCTARSQRSIPEVIPSITPIGTIFLDQHSSTGFFFDRYSTTFSENLQHQPNACIQAVNSSKLFWLSSMFKGKFKHYPGIRLYAEIGPLGQATTEEIQKVDARISALKWTKGSRLIWSSFHHVRDIKINNYRWIECPNMHVEND